MYSKSIKNKYVLTIFIFGIILIFIGCILKIQGNEISKFFLLIGLAFELKSIFMLVYKYGNQIKEFLNS